MKIPSDSLQKYEENISMVTESSNNDYIKNYVYSCNSVDCLSKAISTCTICLKCYCYLHGNGHAHSMDNIKS